jgi:hypothetical protein
MNDLQHVIVDDRISDLLREGDTLRSERRFRSIQFATENDVGGASDRTQNLPARVRLGYWLIGVGATLAGDRHDDVRSRAA